MNISTGKVEKALKFVVYGAEGIGKTTLASQFPDPLFIDTESGTYHLDVKRADPAPSSWSMLLGYVNEVIRDPSVCSTLVVDTADWAERLCIEHVLAEHGAKGIEDFGYGKGYTYVREEFGRMLDKLTDVTERGVNVVVTAHAQIRKFEQPDELGAYDRWELKLNKQDAPLLKEWADALLFLNYKTIIVQPDSKTGGKAKAAGGKRVIYTSHTPAWDAKNRLGLAEELPLDYSSIASVVPAMPTTMPAKAKEAPRAQAPSGDVIARAQEADRELKRIQAELDGKKPESKPEPEPAPAQQLGENAAKVRDLMAQSNIEPEALEAYCADQGYCPPGTMLDVYPEDFLGYLITQWADIDAALSVPFE